MTQIPDLSRGLVTMRDRYLCVRCGMRGTDWHHRRSRSVHNEHTHHPCNGILLCSACHRWVHANPFLARGSGLIVPRYVDHPADVSVDTYMGQMRLDCEGGFQWTTRPPLA